MSQNTANLKQVLDTFNEYFEEKSIETLDDGTKERWADAHELWHLEGAFRNKDWMLSGVIKEDNMRWDFGQLAWQFSELIPHAKHGM